MRLGSRKRIAQLCLVRCLGLHKSVGSQMRAAVDPSVLAILGQLNGSPRNSLPTRQTCFRFPHAAQPNVSTSQDDFIKGANQLKLGHSTFLTATPAPDSISVSIAVTC